MPAHLDHVFTPWRLGALTLPHRVVMGSMHTGLETLPAGDEPEPGAALAAYYAERVRGGAALVITGGVAVTPEGVGGPDYCVLGGERDDAVLARGAAAVHAAGGRIVLQLFHAGRYAPGRSVAPSPVPWRGGRGVVPHELTGEEVRALVGAFAAGAARARELGFDGVEIMGSEGYLVNQFCSPVTNLRDDEWGGDAVRRRRFPVEVVRAVREAVPVGFPVMVRMSGADLVPGSSTPGETRALAVALAGAGADALSVGVGWHESRVPTVQAAVPHGVWLRYARAIRDGLRDAGLTVPVVASNRLTDLRDAEAALVSGAADAVALARPFLADPRIVARSWAGHLDAVNTCIGCDQACIDHSLVGRPVSCLVNPRAGRELGFPLGPRDRGARRRVAVAGGGPAGLAAALDLARRGHAVTLFEAAGALGGQFRLAARIPGKEDYARTVRYYENELRTLGAEIRLRTPAAVEALGSFDAVVVATGVRPRTVDVPGAELPHVVGYERALSEPNPLSGARRIVIVGGGGIGVDVATYLLEDHDPAARARGFEAVHALPGSGGFLEGLELTQRVAVAAAEDGTRPHVTLLRRHGKFGAGIGRTSRWVALGGLERAGAEMITGVTYRKITAEGVEITDAEGRDRTLPADAVVICAGQEPVDALSAALSAAGVRHEVVGGAADALGVDAVRATRQGLEAARRLA